MKIPKETVSQIPKLMDEWYHEKNNEIGLNPETNMWTRRSFNNVYAKVEVDINRDEKEIREYMTVLKAGSLAELFPEIAKEWHPTKNKGLTPDKIKTGSDIKVYWLCPTCGKDYESTVGHRTGKFGTGCPVCGIKKSAAAKARAVVMFGIATGEVLKAFPSISEAAKQMNMSTGNITAVCKGKRPHAGGYGWKYLENE